MRMVRPGSWVPGEAASRRRGRNAIAIAPTSAAHTSVTKPGVVAARAVVQVAHQHRRGGFGDAVGRQHDPHHPAEHAHAEQLRRHQRDDQVFAAEPEAEHHREDIHGRGRRLQQQQRNRAGHQQINRQHHVLPRHAIGQPSHEQPADDAHREDQRDDSRRVALRVPVVEAQVQLEVLVGAADRRNRAHAAEREQVEGGARQDRS